MLIPKTPKSLKNPDVIGIKSNKSNILFNICISDKLPGYIILKPAPLGTIGLYEFMPISTFLVVTDNSNITRISISMEHVPHVHTPIYTDTHTYNTYEEPLLLTKKDKIILSCIKAITHKKGKEVK